nr:a1 mating pheromone [Ustilago maydis]
GRDNGSPIGYSSC